MAKRSVNREHGGTLFTCHAPKASAVFVAGTFNEWNTSATPLERDKNGTWTAKLDLTPGRYEYKFLVDGEWCCEPGCKDAAACPHCPRCVGNEFGTMNRVMEVPPREAA